MAFKLPFLSKGKQDQELDIVDEGSREFSGAADSIEEASNVKMLMPEDEHSIVEPTEVAVEKNPVSRADATFIGDALEKGGDIRLPLIGHLPLPKQIRFLLIAMALFLVLGAVFVWLNASQSRLISTQAQIAGEALMHSQRIGKAAPNAIQGKPAAFKQLEESRKEISFDLKTLFAGGLFQERNVSKADSNLIPVLKDTEKAWRNSDKAADTILKLRKELTGFGQTLETLNSLSPALLELTEQISTLKVQGGANPREIYTSGQLVMLTQRLEIGRAHV